MLSVILPSYNEEKMISLAAETIGGILKSENIDYELVFVDDGSRDATWSIICEVSQRDSHVVGVHFSRNFGKEAAMFAGLEKADGDCVVIIDCDLQHPPEKIVEMYRLWEQGFEVVEGIKEDRGRESFLHRGFANLFYGLMSKATGMNMADASDFKLLDRKVVDALNKMPEKNVFFRALSFWVGFKKAEVSYCVRERVAGESKWSTKSLIKYALRNITSFSCAPMQLATVLGVLMLCGSFAAFVVFIVSLFGFVNSVAGLSCLILLTGGSVLLCLGIIGTYIAKIYEEVKGRPKYIISNIVGK